MRFCFSLSLVLIVLCTSVKLEAQNDSTETIILNDTISNDSLISKEKPSIKHRVFGEYPNPRTALALSLIVPGTGQIYNKKYWKVPIIYGAFGYLGYKIGQNKSAYEDYRDAYAIRVDTIESTTDIYVGRFSTSALKQLRDLRKKGLESNYIFLVVAYVLNGLDAYVDAHLMEFDISDDLSMTLDPYIVPPNNFSSGTSPPIGLTVGININ